MNDGDKYKAGFRKLEEIVGTKTAEAALKAFDDLDPDIGRFLAESVYGDLYQRPGVDLVQTAPENPYRRRAERWRDRGGSHRSNPSDGGLCRLSCCDDGFSCGPRRIRETRREDRLVDQRGTVDDRDTVAYTIAGMQDHRLALTQTVKHLSR